MSNIGKTQAMYAATTNPSSMGLWEQSKYVTDDGLGRSGMIFLMSPIARFCRRVSKGIPRERRFGQWVAKGARVYVMVGSVRTAAS